MTARVNSLLDAKANIGQAISSLETTQVGLEAVEKFAQQLKGLAYAAQSATGAEKDALIAQFDVTRQQLDKLVGDVSYQGTNLIADPADSQRVNLNDKPGNDLVVEGKLPKSPTLTSARRRRTIIILHLKQISIQRLRISIRRFRRCALTPLELAAMRQS